MTSIRPFRLAVLVLLATASLSAASERSDDFAARRARIMERLGPDSMLVLTSAPTRRYSLDVDYEYRQDSNLYYLTGIAQENTALVLMPGNTTRREFLFVTRQDPTAEHWNGRVLTRAQAIEQSGIQAVLLSSSLEDFLAAMLSRTPSSGVDHAQAAAFFSALAKGTARVAFALESGRSTDPLTPTHEFARRLRDRFAGFQTIDATPILTDLRLVKTPYEQKVLRQAVDISADAHLAGMRAARPGVFEYQVKAAIEAVHRGRGAVSWAYPSIVGSGPNATILHYPEADRQMQAGDLLLVDAACNFAYMSPDITRTYPVSGTFSSRQRELYDIVLDAQDAAITVAKPGSSLSEIHNKAADVIKAGLLRLGLITDSSGDQYRMWLTHGVSHYIGIDVHDVGDTRRTLQPGMAFVIEPGVYIRQSALDALPQTEDNVALIAKLRPVVARYEGLGVRVEDSFLLGATGAERLSTTVPRTATEIEAFMRQRPAAAGADR